MTFTVNPEKKRTWNHGWWKDWTQGKVLIGVSVVSMAGLVVTVAHMLLAVDLGLAFSLDAPGQSDAMVSLFLHVVVASVFIVLSCLIFSVVRRSREPQRQTSAESLSVADGWLTFARHVRADTDADGMRVTSARLADCSFWWDEKRRQLVIDAEKPGAIVGWHTDLAHLGEQPTRYQNADMLRLYPFYDPDPVAYLREMGVTERAARSTKWDV